MALGNYAAFEPGSGAIGLSIFLAAIAGVAVFCIVLPLLTFFTAWAADVTGLFRVLFIHKPTRLVFRILRWALALAAAVAIAMAVQ